MDQGIIVTICRYLCSIPTINVNCVDLVKRSPLLRACVNRHKEAVEFLILQGANVLQANTKRICPLHFVSYYSNSIIIGSFGVRTC